jgi:hypothetical protein
VVAGDGADTDSFQKLAADLGLDDSVYFAVPVIEAEKWSLL